MIHQKFIELKWGLKLFLIKLLQKLNLLDEVYYVGSSEALPPPFKIKQLFY